MSWPLCRFNFTKEHVIVDEFVFKSQNYEKLEIYQDYFSKDKLAERMLRVREAPTAACNLLLERNYHYCRIKHL